MSKLERNLSFTWMLQRLLAWLVVFLPQDVQRDLLDYQEQLCRNRRDRLPDGSTTEIQMLSATLAAYRGALARVPLLLLELIQRLDPAYSGKTLYRKFGVRASRQLEQEFSADHYRSSLVMMRASGILMIAFYGIFAVLDIWCLPDSKAIAWTVKAGVVGFLLCTTSLSFQKKVFRRYHQPIISSAMLIAGIGTLLTIALSHPGELGHNTYYSGLLLVIVYLYLLSGLRFFWALTIGGLLLLSYELTELIMYCPLWQNEERLLLVVSNNAFLLTCLFLGSVACNVSERAARVSFMIRYALSHSLRDFLRFFDYKQPEAFLEQLSAIRHSPRKLEKFLMTTYASMVLPESVNEQARFQFREQFLLGAGDSHRRFTLETQSITQSWLNNFISRCKQRLHNWIQAINPSFLREAYRVYGTEALERVEQAFVKDFFYGSLSSTRIAALLAMFHVAAFALLDVYVIPETIGTAIPFRIVICLFLIGVFAATFQQRFWMKYNQIGLIATVIFGSTNFMMIVALPRPTELGFVTYYAGYLTFIFYIFLLAGLRFTNAIISALILFIEYEIAAIFIQKVSNVAEGVALLINNTVFLGCSILVGAIACNLIERNLRLDFLTRYTIAYKAQELLAFYEHQKPSPRQLLDMINGIRHSPRKLEEFLLEMLAFQRGEEGR
jgi:tetrahydromethanopterin S-methyltransferase subunit B